jgi:hypothetical protein
MKGQGQGGVKLFCASFFSGKNEKGSELNNDVAYLSHVWFGVRSEGLKVRFCVCCMCCARSFTLFFTLPFRAYGSDVNSTSFWVMVRAYLYTSPPHLFPSLLTYHSL